MYNHINMHIIIVAIIMTYIIERAKQAHSLVISIDICMSNVHYLEYRKPIQKIRVYTVYCALPPIFEYERKAREELDTECCTLNL